jgi:hypothetical protein
MQTEAASQAMKNDSHTQMAEALRAACLSPVGSDF